MDELSEAMECLNVWVSTYGRINMENCNDLRGLYISCVKFPNQNFTTNFSTPRIVSQSSCSNSQQLSQTLINLFKLIMRPNNIPSKKLNSKHSHTCSLGRREQYMIIKQ